MTVWLAVFGLGAFHGLNPGMGWLFAVALGLQEGRRAAVWRAMLPLGIGHAMAVAAVVLVAVAVGAVVPQPVVRTGVGAILVGLGAWKLVRPRHPRYGGMRVGMAGLTVWSFLMASAHGAGIMVLPAVLGSPETAHAAHAGHMAGHAAIGAWSVAVATLLHGAGYLIVTALAAWLVFEKLGVLVLRRAWWNVDLVWAAALMVTGIVCLLM